MSLSFVVNFLLCIASGISTFLNHAEMREAIDSSENPRETKRKKLELCVLWVALILSIAVLPITWVESSNADTLIKKQGTNIALLETNLTKTSIELAALKGKTEPRNITDGNFNKFIALM